MLKSFDFADLNKEAIKLIEKDIDEAFFLFGLIYKNNTKYESAHNFGVFLSKYGRETSFYQKKMLNLSKKLLLEANRQNESYITLKELGDLYLDLKQYRKAEVSYIKALKKKKTFCVCHNLALSYYLLNDFQNMKLFLEQIIKNTKFNNEDSAQLIELLIFACVQTKDLKQAKIYFTLLLKNSSYLYSPDTLKLAYLCEQFDFILENYKNIFNEWMLDYMSYKIVYQTYYLIAESSLNQYVNWFKDQVESFYSENLNFEQNEKFTLLEQINLNTFPAIEFVIPPTFSCDFYHLYK